MTELNNQPSYAEAWKLPGFTVELCGLNPSNTQHVDAALRIERALNADTEYTDVDPAPTFESQQEWLGEAAGNLDTVNLRTTRGKQTPEEILQGVLAERTQEATIAVEGAERLNEVTDYVYLYRRENSEKRALAKTGLPKQLDASGKPKQMLELSYMHTIESHERMSEAVLEVAAKLMQRVADNTSPDARLSADELAKVSDRLILYAEAGTGDDETEYRQALVNAGAVLVGAVTDEFEEPQTISEEAKDLAEAEDMNYIYYFAPENVQAKLQQKQQTQ